MTSKPNPLPQDMEMSSAPIQFVFVSSGRSVCLQLLEEEMLLSLQSHKLQPDHRTHTGRTGTTFIQENTGTVGGSKSWFSPLHLLLILSSSSSLHLQES